MSTIRVAVVFGGTSGEHPISCLTAASVLRAIDRTRFTPVPIGITRQGQWVLVADNPDAIEEAGEVRAAPASVVMQFDPGRATWHVDSSGDSDGDPQRGSDIVVNVVLPLLHGPFGEDGTIQGVFEMAGLKYAGCGVYASAAGMDKHYTKIALEAAGIAVAPYVVTTLRRWKTARQEVLHEVNKLTYPLFVKPARGGSSLGITRITSPDQIEAAIEAAQEVDPKVIIEQGLKGREIECGVIGGRGFDAPRTSPLGEIVVNTSDWYDWETKYFSADGATLSCPAELPDEATADIQAVAAQAFEALGCEGLSRVDFFWDPSTGPVINEINTLPGFTQHSMFPVMWQVGGMSYSDLLTELIELALERPLGLR